jgi:hypothetical protein
VQAAQMEKKVVLKGAWRKAGRELLKSFLKLLSLLLLVMMLLLLQLLWKLLGNGKQY